MPNRLSKARSPYLKKAMNQPVEWFEWGEEAFSRARELDRPILLSIGGVWCHWCHVMAHESFEDEETAALINGNYVAIKVDRDERPDIDRRYQDAVLRTTGSGGWPLTVFTTPDGKFFYGGTYFPPEDRWQKPGFRKLLAKLSELYRKDRARIEEVSEEIYQNLLAGLSMDTKADAAEVLIEKGVASILSSMDLTHGGLGSAPKFHHSSALEFLINHDFLDANPLIRKSVIGSLDAMAKGGIYDHLLGGFFRYATDEKWLIPHFEKMLYDNAELLRLYSISYKVFRKDIYLSAARGIVSYYEKYGCDPKGGFYTSQDADIGTLDEGGYYTFSSTELAPLLTAPEFQATALRFGIGTSGRMPHEPSRNVLFVDKELEEISQAMVLPIREIRELIDSAMKKMLRYREQNREMPYIDKTIYANWNGLMVEALCVSGNLLGISAHIGMAEMAARRILGDYYHDGRLLHSEGVPGFAEDYIFLSKGLLELYQSTQKHEYLETAKNLADTAIKLFWDRENWGFLDSEKGGPGYLDMGIRNIQDAPVRSVNGIAPIVYMILSVLTGETDYMGYAEKTLKAFASLVEEYPAISYSYLLSLQAYHRGIFKVETADCFDEALRGFRPYKFVVKKDLEGVVICEKETCRKFESYPKADSGL